MKTRLQSQIYEFGEFRVDAAKRLLLRRETGEIVPLTPKIFDTLLYFVENNGKVIGKDELISRIWTDTIVEENNLNKNISVLRRALGEKPGEHRFIVTVPGQGYKFVAEVREIDEAAKSEITDFESQSESKSKIENPEIGGGQKTKNNRAVGEYRWRLGAIFAALAVGVMLFGFYYWRGKENPPAQIKTIAVLPFKPIVAENRNEALELGMADTLISKLSGVEEITVRPLSAVRRFVSPEQDSLLAGRGLGADAVLDGSVQISGERIRITTRLVRTSDAKQLWAEQFDEQLTDIFAVQDSIAKRVTAALQTKLGGKPQKRQTQNVEAYQLYMKGRFHAAKVIQPELVKAIAFLEQATVLDPDYALAYVELSNTYRRLSLTGDAPSIETMPKAKAAALRAIELDAGSADAQTSLGIVASWYEWDWHGAEKHFRRALELAPNNADARLFYAHFLSNAARHEEALAEIKLARELDPTNLVINTLEAQFLLFAGKPDAALDRLTKTVDLDDNFWLAHLVLSRVYAEKALHRKAVEAAAKARELFKANSESIALVAYSLAKSGEPEKSRAALDELSKLSAARYVPPYNFAVIYNALGESEKALDYLEKGFAEKDVRMVFLKVEPKWNNLRREPRFNDLLKRMKLD